jgi:hypothetical protein
VLIQNYGLFWRRDWIHWGKGSNRGHLKGLFSKARTDDPVDFRDQKGIYCLYDDNFKMVYVGQAGSNDNQQFFGRLKDHRKDQLSDRWTRFSWFGIRRVNESGNLKADKQTLHPKMGSVLNHIEAILIVAAEPPHNRQGGRFGDEVEQYLQYRDKGNLGPEPTDAILHLWRKG